MVVNRAVPEGTNIARYYMKKRHVPAQNIIYIDCTREEDVGREEYEKKIAAPVRSFLSKNDPQGGRFLCLVLVYGVPLRVGPYGLNGVNEIRVKELQLRLTTLKEKAAGTPSSATKESRDEIARLEDAIARINRLRQDTSVDSEIALVMEDNHVLEGWLPNKYFVGFKGKETAAMPHRVLPVCRLDGPTEETVYRIIDDSIYAEKHGLKGKAYFDARWPDKDAKERSAYRMYDRAIHNTARIVQGSRKMPVVVDDRETLFTPGEAANAALYCGWYSLGKYVDAFTWSRGAVGYHVASSECTTLRKPGSTVWCKKMLEKGVAATLGPVSEPYLQAFPAPEVFFGCLLEGGSLVECYTISNPFWSWQMVLIGDPLYRPFRPSPAGRD